ncbi:hypothetical protein [Suttonella ornithocola]|uniref:Uncharacterized protein n=1 Tax=Suttonella ornithocola TaxID=279832 RepID=A0A380MZ08_9GAMM|nr:hypothetical protein [Suttonella ornithocola]SUO96921.1 Uncharacterised protein [Suttonella ornithocola]
MYLKYLVTKIGSQESQTPIHDRQEDIRLQLLQKMKDFQTGNCGKGMSVKMIRGHGSEKVFVEEVLNERERHRWGILLTGKQLDGNLNSYIAAIEKETL